MKQHITTEQWSEISRNVQDKLYIQLVGLGTMMNPPGVYDNLNMLTIGQMMEYLGDEWEHEVGTMEYGSYYEREDCPLPDNKELCDALWDTVKLDLVEEEQADIAGIAQEDLKRGDVVTFDIKTGKINKILYGEET